VQDSSSSQSPLEIGANNESGTVQASLVLGIFGTMVE
jgi:hypothetical protein